MKRWIMMILAILFLGLGALGVFLPLLPTTPFLLCASVCAAKSSKRFHHWLTHTALYQKHLNDFVTKHTMKRSSKRKILTVASIMMAFAFYFSKNVYARMVIGALVLFKYYYFIFKIANEPEFEYAEVLEHD